MRKKRFGIPTLVISILLTAALCLTGTIFGLRAVIEPQAMTLLEGLRLINGKFVGEYDQGKVVDYAMEGMVAGLGDRWSYYQDEEQYKASQERRKNAYVGIGITVSYGDERGLLVSAVTPGSPAEQAGIEAGELVVAVEGRSLAGEARYDGPTHIQGEEGTTVSLEVQDAGGGLRTVEVKRQRVVTEPVSYELLEGGVGYVAVKNFYDRSADGVKAAVDELMEQGAVALVFDMRNNGGGYLTELTAMLDYLLPEGPIFRSRDRAGNETITESDADHIDLPMATLVNADTYSAAEFFGAELREWGVGVIVGEETSGKGYSQQTYALPGGGALSISTGAYFTGRGASLIGTGVTLDREVSLTEEENARLRAGKLPREEDGQLQAALALLAEKA